MLYIQHFCTVVTSLLKELSPCWLRLLIHFNWPLQYLWYSDIITPHLLMLKRGACHWSVSVTDSLSRNKETVWFHQVPPLWQMLTFHFLTQQLYLTQPRAPGDLTHTQRYTDTQRWLCVGFKTKSEHEHTEKELSKLQLSTCYMQTHAQSLAHCLCFPNYKNSLKLKYTSGWKKNTALLSN